MSDPVPTELPHGRHNLAREAVESSQRSRIFAALAELSARKGYVNVSVADVVKLAGTSKRTFYEHFSDKQDCFLHAYDDWMQRFVVASMTALTPDATAEQRLIEGFRSGLEMLAATPLETQAFMVEIGSAGPEAFDRRAHWIQTVARELIASHNETMRAHPEYPPLKEFQAVAIIAASVEIAYMSIRSNGAERLMEKLDEFEALARWLVRGDASAGGVSGAS